MKYESKTVDNLSAEIVKLRRANEQLDADLKAAIKKQLSAGMYRDLWLMIEGCRCAEEKRICEEAELLARFADAPHDIAVSAAIKRLANAKARRDEYADMLERLERYG